MIKSARITQMSAPRLTFDSPIIRLYHDNQHSPPLSTAVSIRHGRPVNAVRVQLWLMYDPIAEQPSKRTRSLVYNVSLNLPTSTPLGYH